MLKRLTLEYYDKGKKECIESLRKELESLKQDKEVVDGKLACLLTASKDLDNLIKSQRLDKSKEGLGYTAVPPLIDQLYISPKKDLSWTGLPECADDTVTDYSRPSPTIESTSGDDQNKNSSASKNGESTDSILSKPAVKFVKATERPTTDKVETAKKPAVRYAELYIKTTKRSIVRGNQRNWNNLKSQELGTNFMIKKKACYNCGGIDHLSYNCGLRVKKGRTCPTYTHKNMPPKPSTHRPYRPPMRPNMNSARPNKPAHSYGRRPFPQTTQELMIILIQRIQRLERELKARTPKVDRGKSSDDKEKQRSGDYILQVKKKKLDCRCNIKFRGGLLGIKCSKPFTLAKTTAWNEFSSTMASTIICLATNKKFNFSKYIFDNMVKNLEGGVKFLMFPRKSKKKNTKIPQLSGSTNDVADENVTTTSNDPLLNVSTTEVTTASATTTTIDELTLAQTLIEIKAAKPKAVTTAATITTNDVTRSKARGVIVQEPTEFTTITSPLQPSQLPQAKDKGKAKIVESEKPLKKKDQIMIDEEVAKLVKGSETRVEGSSKRAGEELESENLKKQKLYKNVKAEADDDQEAVKLKKCLEIVFDNGDDVTIDATPLSSMGPLTPAYLYPLN
nr:ribonuclease H-like domain, reverse transcriptase, RNA-dependent DNA polymerase [Tanacetum cinerariifolium]